MNKYEMVVILKPDADEEVRKNVLNTITDSIEADGKVDEVDEWGKRKLAYEINYIKEGYYIVIDFEADPDSIKEIERRTRIQDSVIRYMVIRRDA